MIRWISAGFLLFGALPVSAHAAVPTAPGQLCRQAIADAEQVHATPPGLLAAIGRVETGRRNPASGTWDPWSWSVNADGQASYFNTKAEAVAAVRALQARGVRSIDVGCMQVNLMHHPAAFPSLEQAFDPAANADYAARFLRQLFTQTGAWTKAAASYHSATPDLAAEYQRKVMAVWPEEERAARGTRVAAPWAGTTGGLHPAGRQPAARVIPLATGSGGATPAGRGLDAYRAAPIPLAYRPPPRRRGG